MLKNQFSGVGRIVRALGADGLRVFDIYLVSEIFGKSFRENALPGGRSVILFRTEQNRVQLGGPGGRSTAWPRTVRGAQADGARGPGRRSARPNGQFCQTLTS
jgi:hypothetical protein